MDTDTRPTESARSHQPYRRWWLLAGWGTVAALAAFASFRGGIAMDLMLAVMTVVGWFSETEVLPFQPDWPGALLRTGALLLAGYLAVRTTRYQRHSRGACPRCGRPTGRTAVGWRWEPAAAAVAAAVAVAYAALKLHWGFGGTVGLTDPELFPGVRPWSPGMGDTAVMALFGAALGFALALGRPRLPRWLLLPPAVVGCLMLLPVGVFGTGQTVAAVLGGDLDSRTGGIAEWVVLGIYPAFLLWGLTLAAVTLAFHLRTRGRCRRCGRE